MKQAMIDTMRKPKHDHFDTPDYAVFPLMPHIPKGRIVWEPTDTTGKSNISAALKNHGCEVVSTSKKEFDFLTDTPGFDFDYIITNPPYTLKDRFIERCYELKKPWALLLPLTALEGVKRGKLFGEHGLELMVLNRRVEFTGGSVWFPVGWFCYRILSDQLMFAEIEKRKK